MSAVRVTVDGQAVAVPAGASVLAAVAAAGGWCTRRSVGGERRFAFCGMGVCQECAVRVDGVPRLACGTRCTDGVKIATGDAS